MALVVDQEINTKDKAAALVDAEAAETAGFYEMPVEDARANLLASIGYCTGYYDTDTADRILDLFETEHPIFGRTHPTPAEALKMGMELGAKSLKKEKK
jgi:hypothetical protein